MHKIFVLVFAVSFFMACNNHKNTDQDNNGDSLMPVDKTVVDSANATIQRWNDSAQIRMDSAGRLMENGSGFPGPPK